MENGFRVVIAADGRPFEFLRKEFPECSMVRFPGTRITYQKTRFLAFKLMLQVPAFLFGIRREHNFLKKLILAEKPSVIVSDNRYGAWSKSVRSIFITHQLRIILPQKLKFSEALLNRISRDMIRKFSECWIPDFEFHNGLAGKLSHPGMTLPNMQYIGTLSRFSTEKRFSDAGIMPVCDLLVMLSGPEPQRTVFEGMIINMIIDSGLKAIVVRGKTEEITVDDAGANVRVYSHLPTAELRKAILQSHLVICRSGYSSIMDLVTLGKQAIFVPTPGQTEQEYLATYLKEKKIFFSMAQDKFDLLYAIEMSRNFPGMVLQNDYKALEERIRDLKNSSPLPG
jgi:UDP:flavonoid glycosyltransferase YjiC (YdhE family)